MYKVEGYDFESKEAADKAKLEADGVKYIKENTRMDNPDMIYKLYDQIIREEMFETPVGLSFLAELQEYLYANPEIENEVIRPIPVHAPEIRKIKAAEKKIGKYRKKFRTALFFAIVLGAVVIGMFGITYYSGSSVTILNYENALIDKYEDWENDLDEREQKLKEREADLTENTEELPETESR